MSLRSELEATRISRPGLLVSSATTADEPKVETRRWAEMDTTQRSTRSSTRVAELLQAFDQLNVSVDDQIAIIYELQKTGKLHAEIVHR